MIYDGLNVFLVCIVSELLRVFVCNAGCVLRSVFNEEDISRISTRNHKQVLQVTKASKQGNLNLSSTISHQKCNNQNSI